MSQYILALILIALALGGVIVRKTYYYLPPREMKRRAEHDDPLAARLYPAVAYGSSLRGLLWAWIGLTSAAGFVLLIRVAPAWMGFIAIILLLWIVYSWLPASRVTRLGANVTAGVTPAVLWLLGFLHPIAGRSTEIVERRYTAARHTGLFERQDLLELIEQQQRQPDNRLTEEELEIARRALSFSDIRVRDVMVPRKKVKVAVAKDTVGPVLIDELHRSGQKYMLVRATPKGDFVGTVAFARMGLESSGQVKDVMDRGIGYVHENDRLSQALHAFFKTNCPALVVVDSSEEFVGILTVQTIIQQLLGHVPGDDFDQYADSAVVAARHVHPKTAPEVAEEKTEKADGETLDTDEDAAAVVAPSDEPAPKTDDEVVE